MNKMMTSKEPFVYLFIYGLKTTEIYSLRVLEARHRQSRCQQGRVASEGSRGESSLVLSKTFFFQIYVLSCIETNLSFRIGKPSSLKIHWHHWTETAAFEIYHFYLFFVCFYKWSCDIYGCIWSILIDQKNK